MSTSPSTRETTHASAFVAARSSCATFVSASSRRRLVLSTTYPQYGSAATVWLGLAVPVAVAVSVPVTVAVVGRRRCGRCRRGRGDRRRRGRRVGRRRFLVVTGRVA